MLLLVWVARIADWGTLAGRLEALSPAALAVAFLPLAGITLLVAIRWSTIASAVARPLRVVEAWTAAVVASALDQVLVSMSGEAYRIWWLRHGAPSLTSAIAGVVLDRVAGVLGIAILVLAFLPRFAALEGSGQLVLLPVGMVVAAFGGLLLLLVLDRLPQIAPASRWISGIRLLSALSRRVFLAVRVAAISLAAAVGVHICASACMSFVAAAAGIPLTLASALTVIPPVIFVSMLPVSIGGWGVREGAMVVALGLTGIEPADALLISVTYGVMIAIVGLIGGILWLLGIPGRLLAAKSLSTR